MTLSTINVFTPGHSAMIITIISSAADSTCIYYEGIQRRLFLWSQLEKVDQPEATG